MARLEILDVGSNKGKALKANAEEALHELGMDLPIEDVSDISRLLEYGISGIPALVVDGRVVLQKMVPSAKELRVMLSILLSSPTGSHSLTLRSIVAPTDFSEISFNALAYAKSIAAVQSAGLSLVHVHQAQAIAPGPFPVPASQEDVEWKNGQLDSFLGRPVYTNGFESGRVLEPGSRTWLDSILGPLERGTYALLGVRADRGQTWKEYAVALLTFGGVGCWFTYAILRLQHWLPLNPQESRARASSRAIRRCRHWRPSSRRSRPRRAHAASA